MCCSSHERELSFSARERFVTLLAQVRSTSPLAWPFSHLYIYSAGAQAYWNTKATPRLSLLDHLSPRGSAQELTVASHAIDDELSALHMIMCALRTRRNNFSLIGRLPPEILSCIFSFHAINQPVAKDPIYYFDSFPSTPTQVGLGWITVTHVCRHWRQVALSNPNLWRTIVFDLGAEWAEEMLTRSKAALISYIRDMSFQPRIPRRTLDDQAALSKHLSHVQRLVLSGTAEHLAPAMRALTTPAPHLESLELHGNSLHVRELCVSLPSDIFAHQSSKLRHVTLVDCSVPWESSLFRDLTYLEIRIPANPQLVPPTQIDPLGLPSLDRFLSILEAMPSLQVLSLVNCLPRPNSTSRVVPLQHMIRLSLEGRLSESVAVLQHVSLPGSASLSLRCPVGDPVDGVPDTLISLLSTHFQASISSLSTLSIGKTDYPLSLILIAWDTEVSPHRPQFIPSVSSTRLNLSLGCRDNTIIQSFLLRMCKALPLRDLRTLSATRSSIDWMPTDWVDLSNHCPKVTHLCVDGGGAFRLAPTLSERTVFPALVTLALQNVNFACHWPDEQPLHVTFPACLRARRKAGIPIRRVEITSCAVEHTWVESFGEVVNDVVWDFDRGEFDSDSERLGSFTFSDSGGSWRDDV